MAMVTRMRQHRACGMRGICAAGTGWRGWRHYCGKVQQKDICDVIGLVTWNAISHATTLCCRMLFSPLTSTPCPTYRLTSLLCLPAPIAALAPRAWRRRLPGIAIASATRSVAASRRR